MNKVIPAGEVLNCIRKRATIASTFSIPSSTRKKETKKIEYFELKEKNN
jgi:hypothetical protein